MQAERHGRAGFKPKAQWPPLAEKAGWLPFDGAERERQLPPHFKPFPDQGVNGSFCRNRPRTHKLASLHFEYGHSAIVGPAQIVTAARGVDEVRIGFRVSLQQYIRH